MIGSLGCPYTCSFCIDSTVDYQPLGFAQVSQDLSFLLTKMKHPIAIITFRDRSLSPLAQLLWSGCVRSPSHWR